MDAAEFLKQFHDYLAPRLDAYEQAIYLYAVRHTRLVGQLEGVIGFKSARRAMALGLGKMGSPMSEAVCYEKLRCLEKKGCLKLVSTDRLGTRLRVALPAEIPGLIPDPQHVVLASSESADFFNVAENRARILEREGHRCFYCLRQLTADNYVIEHVVSRPDGDNSYKNVVAACRRCNNRKGTLEAEGHLRELYREALLGSEEFQERIGALTQLREGLLKPPAV